MAFSRIFPAGTHEMKWEGRSEYFSVTAWGEGFVFSTDFSLSVVFSDTFIRIKIVLQVFLTLFAKINFAVIFYWVQPQSMVNTAVFLSSATATRILWCSSARTWQGIVYQGEYSSEQKLWWVCSGFYENLQALLVLLCILDRTIIKQLTIQCSFRRVDLLKNQKGRDPQKLWGAAHCWNVLNGIYYECNG